MEDLQWKFQPVRSADELGTPWDEFNARTMRTPLLDSAFLRSALTHFGNGDEQLAVASDAQGTAAMCILRMRGPAVVETFQPSQLPVCPWLQRTEVDLSDLAHSLVRDLGRPIVLAALTQLDPMLVKRPTDGPLLKTLSYITTGNIELRESLEQYMSGRSGNLLANLRRRQRNIEHEYGTISLQVLDASGDMEGGITLYSHLESAGWKGKLGTAIERGNVQWHFYLAAMSTLCEQRRGKVFVLRYGDQIAAAALAVVDASTTYMLKTTHNEHLRSYSPGSFLRREVIASLHAAKPCVDRIEMYGPLNASQRPWITGTREMYHVNAYRAQTIARLHSFSKRLRPRSRDHAADVAHRGWATQSMASIRTGAFETFDALPRPMRTALERDEAQEVFYSLDWFELLAKEVFTKGASPKLVSGTAERGGAQLQMLLPLVAIPAKPGWYAVRRLQSLANYYSSLFGPVSAGAGQDDLEPMIVAAAELVADARPEWDIVDLHPLDVRSAFWEIMQRALRREGYWTDSYHCFGNWYLPVLVSTFDEYFAGRPSQLKSALKAGSKRIFRDPTANLTIVTDPGPELDRAIAAYEITYENSWKYSEPYPKFIPRLCELAARKGWLRLGILRIGDRPAAAQVWLVKDGKASIYKVAYDQEFAKVSPGTVLTAALMRHAIEVDKVREVDYLAGDDAYKRGWMSHRRERRGIVAFNPRTLWGLGYAAAHFGGKIVQAGRRHFRPAVAAETESEPSGDKPRDTTVRDGPVRSAT